MKKPVHLLLPAIALALVPATVVAGGAEARTGAGSFTVAPTVALPASACVTVTYDLTLMVGEDTDDWYADVTVLDPDGRQVGGFETDVYDDSGAQSFDDDVSLCGDEDDPGTYRIVGDLYTTNGGSTTYIRQALTPSTFVVTGGATTTTVDVKGTVTRKPVTRGVELTFRAAKIPASATVGTGLRWSVVVDGKVRSFAQRPGTTVRKKYVFAKASGTHRVQVLRNGKVTLKVTVRT